MNKLTTFAPDGNITMSSREIAGLVEKRHDNVKRTIESLAGQGVIVRPQIEDEQDTDRLGRLRTTSIYRLEKRDTFVVVAQLSPEFTARVVDRWQELENKQHQIPQNYPDALRLAAEQAEQIAALTPKAVAYERLEASEGSVIPRVAAKALDVPERKFFRWLYANNWAFKQGKTWQGYSDKIKAGYLEHETRTFEVDGEERTKVQLKITAKGMARLSAIFSTELVPT